MRLSLEILLATFVWRTRRSRSDGFVGNFLSFSETTSISSSAAKTRNENGKHNELVTKTPRSLNIHQYYGRVYGLRFMAYGLRFTVYGLWFMVYGLWLIVHGLWLMVYSRSCHKQEQEQQQTNTNCDLGKLQHSNSKTIFD